MNHDRSHTTVGYAVLYAAIDDATRLGYTEQLGDEGGETAAHSWRVPARSSPTRASPLNEFSLTMAVHFDRGVDQRLHGCTRASALHPTISTQTNGKVEHFSRTLVGECLHAQSNT